jgi:hypothetical protein
MITTYIIKGAETGIPYLSTISRDRAEEWLEVANEGGCRSMDWSGKEFTLEVRHRSIKKGGDTWEF